MKISFFYFTCSLTAVLAVPNSGIRYDGRNNEGRSVQQFEKRIVSFQCMPQGYLCYRNEACCSGRCDGVFSFFGLFSIPGQCVEASSSSTSSTTTMSTTRSSSMMPTTTRSTSTTAGRSSSPSSTTVAVSFTTTSGPTTARPSSPGGPVYNSPASSITGCLETGTRVIMIHTTVDFTTGELDRWTITDVYTVSCSSTAIKCASPATVTTVVTATDNIAKNDTASFSYGTRTLTYLSCSSTAPATADPKPTSTTRPSQPPQSTTSRPSQPPQPTTPSTTRPTTTSTPRVACLTFTEFRVSIVSTITTRDGSPETDYSISPYTTIQTFCFTRGGGAGSTTPRSSSTSTSTMMSTSTSTTPRTSTTSSTSRSTTSMSMSMSMPTSSTTSMSMSMSIHTTVMASSTIVV